jgi:hypothetical protein
MPKIQIYNKGPTALQPVLMNPKIVMRELDPADSISDWFIHIGSLNGREFESADRCDETKRVLSGNFRVAGDDFILTN